MWWGGRPRHCLKIGPDALVWAQFGHGWTGRRHDRCVVRPLDPDLIRVSPTELNVLQSGTIQEQLRLMTAPSRGSRLTGRRGSGFPIPIVLLLPDVCVRTAVFELDRVPRRREEREALVRWRFGQDHLFPLTEAKVVYQLLSGEGSNDSGERTSVLAAAMHQAVLEQYEALCVAIQLLPVAITTPSFQLCDLWMNSQPAEPRGQSNLDVLWISLLDQSFSVLGFRQGRPVFTRSKVLPPRSVTGSGLTAAQRAWIVRESIVSMEICRGAAPEGVVKRAVLASGEPEPELVQELEARLGMDVEPLEWSLFRQLGWTKRMQQLPLCAMSAVAGLC
ncbi:hypothetical protein YTPLAS18_23880 [Nitrospira sp.]|nr:hypothetical protein YTPLAS18_23880 [Nitrospira sp.]